MFALNRQKVLFRYFILLSIALICWNCAQQGSPSGGPRDEDPPVVLECEPPNYSTRFEAEKILITFDEFIVLDNVNQQLIVSPPMEEKPEVKLRKKTIIIQFGELLKDSTTYTLNFGSSIKDLHEGNKLLNYEYVFSTGDILDSLSVKGTLKYASDLSNLEESVTVMLYNDLRDSVPLTDIPLYVGRSDDSGLFSINNLRPDLYKVFALKDGNNNLLFDLPTEEIGFLDSNLIVNAEFARTLLESAGDSILVPGDSILVPEDSILVPEDSIPVPEDSIPVPEKSVSMVREMNREPGDTTGITPDSLKDTGPDLNSIYIDLLMFTEENEIQYITDYTRDDPRKIEMVFARSLTDTFQYKFLTTIREDTVKVLEYFNAGRDSLTFWIKDSSDYNRDTLMLEVRYTARDTANQFVSISDTLIFSYREKPAKKKNKEDQEKEKKLVLSTIRKNGEQHLNRDLAIDLDLPFASFNDSLISLYYIPDSVEIPEPVEIFPDTSILTRVWIKAEWKSAALYRMILLPGAIKSIYPLQHDTLDIPFRTRDIEAYGQILLNLENVNNSVIIQLISKEKIIRQMGVSSSGEYTFGYLMPQDYRIKIIHDLNNNGKWDTGKYIKKIQPEPVELLPVAITVRSNWDHDITMKLEK